MGPVNVHSKSCHYRDHSGDHGISSPCVDDPLVATVTGSTEVSKSDLVSTFRPKIFDTRCLLSNLSQPGAFHLNFPKYVGIP